MITVIAHSVMGQVLRADRHMHKWQKFMAASDQI